MKKILSLILAFALCFTAVAAIGCGGNTPEPVKTEEKLEIKENLSLTLGDTVELAVSYNEVTSGKFVWSSSAPKIVSVNEYGVVEALNIGTATVTVAYGNKTASCKVEVGLSSNVPTIAFDDDVSERITIMKNSVFGLGAHIQFNGKKFDDGEIEYFVSDEKIGSVIGGEFVAKDVAGITAVSVSATWRGQTVRSKTVFVNVIAEETVLLNGGMLTSIKLYTVSEHEGVSYSVEQSIASVFVSENETEITDYDLSIADEEVATIEKTENHWIVKANKAGKTNLIVSYGNKEFPFAVTVNRPVAEVYKPMDYSLSDEKYFDGESETFKTISEMIEGFSFTSYVLDGKEYAAKNGKFDLKERDGCKMTVYNENVGYAITVNVYTMILDELKDFEKIYAGTVKTDIKGTYLLGKDIIEPDTVLTMPSGKVPNNFAGNFDGQGHVLSFTFEHGTAYRFGLFGERLKGATIKNLALNNVTMDGTTGKLPAGIICGEGSDGAASTVGSTLENIFVDLKFSTAREVNLVLMGNLGSTSAGWTSILKNVIIHAEEVPTGTEYGSFARGNAAQVSNSYVISPMPMYYITTQTTNFQIVPTRYDSYERMLAAGNDYSSFSAEFWDITTYGVPVWKTLVEDFNG